MANIRCAIYTRKSTEEGLEQNFNSLDAQREACAAFITSQKHEGWQALPESYDDGGFSGGNVNRPALKRLMADIKAGKVNTIVVYKIDRLTRSLADFAKMVDVFDQYKVSFVSVTQQFNTTTSMGRLTLNVLLSFAQFEREVTGERIRDKIAASKAKGMWMGGTVPLGYEARDRELIINTEEAGLIQLIYARYVALGSVQQLRDELHAKGYKPKARQTKNGKVGGQAFYIGPLHHILTNRLYVGEINHKGKVYPGNHQAIIDRDLWDEVQTLRHSNRRGHEHRIRAKERSLLAGRLFDAEGHPMSPCHSNRPGKRYRYYISQGVVQGKALRPDTLSKVPAGEVERVVSEMVWKLLGDDTQLNAGEHSLGLEQRERARQWYDDWHSLSEVWRHTLVRDVVLNASIAQHLISCVINMNALACRLQGLEINKAGTQDTISLTTPIKLRRINGGPVLVLTAGTSKPSAPSKLALAVARGYFWNQQILQGKAESVKDLSKQLKRDDRHIHRTLPLAWLAPPIVEAILAQQEPENTKLEDLLIMAEWPWDRQLQYFYNLR